ncbi:MAG: [acyl-carrier-protein] S-malonyltransferase [Flavobacteriaceae bacterium]|nr:[acyl-carrier-protein] S-malonyltransferase [Flavobacteriaceae bacterium]|tara:strand:- start:393 stop:1268 length:876 start_codon:yes stop_codon:yes gene_type:complete
MRYAQVFPGQGSQFVGMGKELFDNYEEAKKRFLEANKILGFQITQVMFEGNKEELKETNIAQPAIFIHSIIKSKLSKVKGKLFGVAGHSLGEFSALVASNSISFKDGLELVKIRANEMKKACEVNPGTMAAVIGLDNKIVENCCLKIKEVVVPANYNCPGQIVVSGEKKAIVNLTRLLNENGARKVIPLNVGGAFHSPLMFSAKKELENYIQKIEFKKPSCPIYQNCVGKGVSSIDEIKKNLVNQLTSPVLWTQSINQMTNDGINNFVEVGPGKVLQGLIKKINPNVNVDL